MTSRSRYKEESPSVAKGRTEARPRKEKKLL